MNNLFNSTAETIQETVFLHFDGGTPCNNPEIGFGIGYGSYRFNSNEIVRVNHGIPCSNNAAEVLTVCVALEHLSNIVEPHRTAVHIWADSQIAIKWILVASGSLGGKQAKMSNKASETFKQAVRRLSEACEPFAKITAEWKPREWAVRAFGH